VSLLKKRSPSKVSVEGQADVRIEKTAMKTAGGNEVGWGKKVISLKHTTEKSLANDRNRRNQRWGGGEGVITAIKRRETVRGG